VTDIFDVSNSSGARGDYSCTRSDNSAAKQAMMAALSAARRWRRIEKLVHFSSSSGSSGGTMPHLAQFEFDLNGYCVVPSVFTPTEVAAANAAVDAHRSEQHERGAGLRNTKGGTAMSGDGETGRLDLGHCLEWPMPHSAVFRDVLAHPKLLQYFRALLGPGYRMDHLPLVLAQTVGAEGFQLHGGVTAPVSGEYQPHLEYSWRHGGRSPHGPPDVHNSRRVDTHTILCAWGAGTMRNMLLGCTLQLVDHDPGDGGFCIVKGSHKANVAMPAEMVHGTRARAWTCMPAAPSSLYPEMQVGSAPIHMTSTCTNLNAAMVCVPDM
jgi:hypothetical protein